jgi:CRISPR-associated exonuclease Cas4
MSNYPEDAFLQLSGIQHFIFCPRQWGLIHLEQQWAENVRTTEGKILHERAHDGSLSEKRGDLLILRDLRVHSHRLGVSGACDVVEFYACRDGISLARWEGRWRPFPVEYKRGRPKKHQADVLQLCAQAICLEEMLCCTIEAGAIYYAEIKRRQEVYFSPELRKTVEETLSQMQDYAARGHTPRAKPSRSCNACSMINICLPKLRRCPSAQSYLCSAVEEVRICENF